MIEQVFLMEEVWSMHNAVTQCRVQGKRRPKDIENFLCLNFSYLAIKYEFYFIIVYYKILNLVPCAVQ